MFYNVDINDMMRISITEQGEQAAFFLDSDNRWRLDSLDGLPVGLDRWGGVTLLLSGPRPGASWWTPNPPTLSQYGLASPSSRIDIDLKDGRAINVLMGFPTPDEVGFYGQVEGFPQVYTIVKSWKDVHTRLIYEPRTRSGTTKSTPPCSRKLSLRRRTGRRNSALAKRAGI